MDIFYSWLVSLPTSLGGWKNTPTWTCLCDRKDKFKIPFWAPPKSWFGDSGPFIHLNSPGKFAKSIIIIILFKCGVSLSKDYFGWLLSTSHLSTKLERLEGSSFFWVISKIWTINDKKKWLRFFLFPLTFLVQRSKLQSFFSQLSCYTSMLMFSWVCLGAIDMCSLLIRPTKRK